MARDAERLAVFHLAHQLALDVYGLTQQLPIQERWELGRQLRRAAASIPTNIAEGCARRSARDYGRFLDIAAGSAAEVRYLLRLAADLQLLPGSNAERCISCSNHVVRALLKLQLAVEGFERRAGAERGPTQRAR